MMPWLYFFQVISYKEHRKSNSTHTANYTGLNILCDLVMGHSKERKQDIVPLFPITQRIAP